jgi:Winged helix DNA-binding domain
VTADDGRIRQDRLRSQLLTSGRAARTALDAVRHLVGIQAQIRSAAALAVRARTTGVHNSEVDRAVEPGGPLVRTWLMRGTLHLVASDDLNWLLAALVPVVLRASRRRYAQLGLDSATLVRATDVLREQLDQQPATRARLFAALRAHRVDPAGQRGIYLIRHAALHGVLVSGPDHGREQTWVRRDESPRADRDEALVTLARRYRAGYGPADARDLAGWSGLPLAEAERAVRLAGEPDERADPRHAGQAAIKLLPHFDPYVVGYAGRDHAVPAQHRRSVWTGGGYVLPTVMRDGVAMGTWRSEPKGARVVVTIRPFDSGPLPAAVSAGVSAEVADIARFLGREVSWSADVT